MIRLATLADLEQITTLYRNAITIVNIKHYSTEQTAAWASRWNNTSAWTDKITNQHFLVTEENNIITGFASVTYNGHVDMLFVHHNHQGKGIARGLLNAIEHFAVEQNITLLTTDASITARPVFERFGFSVVTPQIVTVDGVDLTNFKMNKLLAVN